MHHAPDLFATLQQIVQRAMAVAPRSPRGGLLLCEGPGLVYRALEGFDSPSRQGVSLPADAGPAVADREGAACAPSAAPEAARGMCVVSAHAWYEAHLPPAVAPGSAAPEGAGVLVAPIHLRGAPVGYLALEQATLEPPSGERRAMIEVFLEAAGAALERNRLYDEKARSAQEIRLLEQVLSVVGTTIRPHDLIETLAQGIKSVQIDPQWSSVELWLLEEASRGDDAAPAASAPVRDALEARVYRAPLATPTTYFHSLRDGAVDAARSLGITIDFRVGPGHGEGCQGEILDDGIRRGVDGIIIAPGAPEAAEDAFRRAAAAGIPVIVVDTPPVPGSRAPLYIGTDNVAAGRLAGEMMRRLLPGGGVVAPQRPTRHAINTRERVEGFCAALSGSNIDVLPPDEDCGYDQACATEYARRALGARPDLAGAFGVAGVNGPAWGRAARELGRGGDLKIIGFDLADATVALLRRGMIHATIVQREYDMGFRAAEIIHRMIHQGVEPTLAELPASRILHTGVDCVTLEHTPWSTTLSDHLALDTARRVASRRVDRAPAGARPVEVLLIGVSAREEAVVEERASLSPRSLLARVIAADRPLVIDPAEHDGPEDAALSRGHAGARTLVGLPLRARGSVVGAIVLGSAHRGACAGEDLCFLERVAGTAAVAIENARLFGRISERTDALERANRQQESMLRTINELSSPVVPIADGILVMPVVGTMDAQRSSRFIESLLREIDEHDARVVLIDVTGMAVVDAEAANQLVRAAQAAALLGAEAVLVGVAGSAARMMVAEGVDVGTMTTHVDLARGVRYALAKTGGRIVYQG
ncbi:substrate-binding domain-containing protein [Sorangium sp. So ce1099]|uniref:substrate-binding domain-containing protein n=1 Tax=Sorangium sp. So ce1099 TaxID=3133331 RepID=UPI003F6104AF